MAASSGRRWLVLVSLCLAFAAAGALSRPWLVARLGGLAPAVGQVSESGIADEPAEAALLLVTHENVDGPPLSDEQTRRRVRSHVGMLEWPGMADDVFAEAEAPARQTAWYKRYAAETEAGRREMWRRALRVRAVPDSNLIAVRFDCDPPVDAAAIAEALCDLHIERSREAHRTRTQRRVEMLVRESRSIELDLDENVTKPLREKELMLGNDTVGTFSSYNGKQLQLDRMLNEQTTLQTAFAAATARQASLEQDVKEGRTPPDVDHEVRRSPEYDRTRAWLDEAEVALAALEATPDKADADVARAKRRVELLGKRLTATESELRGAALDRARRLNRNEVNAAVASLQLIQERIGPLAQQLGELNKAMNDYRVLQTRENDLRRKLQTTQDEIARIRQFVLPRQEADLAWVRKPKALP